MCPREGVLEAISIIAGVTSTMASFDKEDFAAKLKNLGTSQKDINTLSKFMIAHHSKIDSQREIWETVFDEVGLEQRITLMYLINDVIQFSRSSHGNLFVSSFLRMIEVSLRKFQKDERVKEDSKSMKTLMRICEIWRDRGCYQPSQTAKFLAILSGNAPTALDEILLPDLVSRPATEELQKSKNPLIKALLASEENYSTDGLKADRVELLKNNIMALVEQTDAEQVVAVTGKANPKTPNDLVVEEIPIDCKKSYKIIDEYLQILKRQRKKKEGLVKLLKEQVTAFTDDLLSNKPQDDLTKETSTSKMIFENLCLTWDAISQYELLQSQQRQGGNRVFQEQHKPPPAPRPFMPHRGAPIPRMPSMQHQNLMHQRQPRGPPGDWNGDNRHMAKRRKMGHPPPQYAPMQPRLPHQFNYQQQPRPRMMQQQPPRGRGRGRVNNMPAWMTQ